jgi:hypothetical protein
VIDLSMKRYKIKISEKSEKKNKVDGMIYIERVLL